jgi:hypothetical protein
VQEIQKLERLRTEVGREKEERRMLVSRGSVLMLENREVYSLMNSSASYKARLLEEVGFNMKKLIANYSVEAENAVLHNSRLQSKLKTLLSELDVLVSVMEAESRTHKDP